MHLISLNSFFIYFIIVIIIDNWKKDERALVLEYAKLIQNNLPRTNFDVLHYIILVASWIQHYRHLNRMNPEALAVVLAPICSGLENNIYGQLKSNSSSTTTTNSTSKDYNSNINKLSSSSSTTTTAATSAWLTNDINISNYQQLKENMDQFIQLNIKWTSIWTLMIQHHDVLLDYWRSTNLSMSTSMSPRDISHSLIWQRHSMPTSKIENGGAPLLWTQSTITVPEEKSTLMNDDDDDENDDIIPPLPALPTIISNQQHHQNMNMTNNNPSTTKLLTDDDNDRYGVIVIRKQYQGFRRRFLSGVAKDDENIYLDTPLPPLPIPSYPKDTIKNSTTTTTINNKLNSMDNHELNMKSTKKRSFLLRRPKSIATLQPRMKATVL